MFPASNKGSGQILAFPDVCKTPAPPAPFAPIPYPNQGSNASAKKDCAKVKICGLNALTKASEYKPTLGDQAGTLKGMVSMTTGDKAVRGNGSGKVKFGGKPAVHALGQTRHNGSNANAPPGAQIAPDAPPKVILMG